MPLSLSDLHKKRRKLTVEYEGDQFTVEYNPQLVTRACMVSLREDWGIYDLLLRVMTGWELLDKPGGKAIPITEKQLEDLPANLISAIGKSILDDMSPEPEKGGAPRANGGSFTDAESDEGPNAK